jgi:hypothetical protein
VDIVKFSFNGQATVLWAGTTLPIKLQVLDDGTIVAIGTLQITDVETHEVLIDYTGASLPGIPPYTMVAPIDVTGDGIAVLQSHAGNYGGLSYYDVYDGSLLWTGPAPQRNGQNAFASVSRYATYMSTIIDGMYANRISIETTDGFPAVVSPFTISSYGSNTSFYEWVSDGTMLICDGGMNTNVYRWDIYATPTLLYNNWPYNSGCPAAAG